MVWLQKKGALRQLYIFPYLQELIPRTFVDFEELIFYPLAALGGTEQAVHIYQAINLTVKLNFTGI